MTDTATRTAFDDWIEGNFEARDVKVAKGSVRIGLYRKIGDRFDQVAIFYDLDAFGAITSFADIATFNAAMAGRRDAFAKRKTENIPPNVKAAMDADPPRGFKSPWQKLDEAD